MDQPRHLFRLFSFFFKLKFYKKTVVRRQRDLNSDRQSRRRARWPLDHTMTPYTMVQYSNNCKYGSHVIFSVTEFGKIQTFWLKWLSLWQYFLVLEVLVLCHSAALNLPQFQKFLWGYDEKSYICANQCVQILRNFTTLAKTFAIFNGFFSIGKDSNLLWHIFNSIG